MPVSQTETMHGPDEEIDPIPQEIEEVILSEDGKIAITRRRTRVVHSTR